MDICMCAVESLHCSPETTTLLIGCIPVQNKKLKVWEKKICEPSASPSHENKMKGLKTTEGRCLKLLFIIATHVGNLNVKESNMVV